MSCNNHRFQSTFQSLRSLVSCTLPLAFLALSGCAGVIQSLANSDGQRLSSAPHGILIPSRMAQGYESPIPRWNSPYQGATSQNPGDRKRLARAYRTLDVVDGVLGFLAEIGNPGGSADLTPVAISFCIAGAPQHREKEWFGNMFSLQPGSLASAIFEGRLKHSCEISYWRRH